ncbi:N-ATPase subunit AtpR [Metallibacterium sp.]
MNTWLLRAASAYASWPLLLPGLLLGFFAGLAYFHAIWRSARALVSGRHKVLVTVALTFGRLILLTGLLYLAAQAGALVLLLTALGVLAGRFVVMRRVRRDG